MLHCTLAELPERISYEEWLHWAAWYGLFPADPERADMRAAIIAHAAAYGQVYTAAARKRGDMSGVRDFLAVDDGRGRHPDRNTLLAKLHAFAAMLRGTKRAKEQRGRP